jgi:thioredoxin reductase
MVYDVIVIGGGPAGLTAATAVTQQHLKCVLLAHSLGGQLNLALAINNWPAQEKISGKELSTQLVQQLKATQIVDIKGKMQVSRVRLMKQASGLPTYEVITDTSDKLRARAVILAMGARHKSLGLPGEERLTGKGVSYCAVCDATYFKNKVVAVLGGGIAAESVTQDLSRIAKRLYILQFEKNKGQQPKNVEVLYGASPAAVLGQDHVTGLRYLEVKTNKLREIAIDGVFIEAGSNPNSEPVKDLVDTDGRGQVIVDHQTMATSQLGIFAAGDITNSHYKQVSLATADGIRAALSAVQYLGAIKETKEV